MLTKNFYNLLKCCAGTNFTLNPVYTIYGIPIYSQYVDCYSRILYASQVGEYSDSFNPVILLGSSNTQPSLDALSFTPIKNRESSGTQYLITSIGYKKEPTRNEDTVSCIYHIQIIGNNSSPVTITELGLASYVSYKSGSSTYGSHTLLDRTRLSSPVTINNGDTVFLDYEINVTLSLNIF